MTNFTDLQQAEEAARAAVASAASRSPVDIDASLEKLRAEQANAVMPLIGPLLDALDGLPNDVRGMLSEAAPRLFFHLVAVREAMEGDAGIPASAPCPGYVRIPQEPPIGLLMSMALRRDHALGMPGYYDTFDGKGGHARRVEAAIGSMRQIYEEVAGMGFHKPEREADYAALLDECGNVTK